MLTLKFALDLKLQGPNAREHWAETARRRKIERAAAYHRARHARVRPLLEGEIATITMTRTGRRMDDDNLAAAFKAVRDGIADALEIDDGDERLSWVPRQERAWSERQGLEIEVHYDERRRK
jgi:hypothetical protein